MPNLSRLTACRPRGFLMKHCHMPLDDRQCVFVSEDSIHELASLQRLTHNNCVTKGLSDNRL